MLNIEKEVLYVLAERLAERGGEFYSLPVVFSSLADTLMDEEYTNNGVSLDRQKAKQWLLSNYDEIETFVARYNIDWLPSPFSNAEQCELAVWTAIARKVVELSPTLVNLKLHGGLMTPKTMAAAIKEWRDAIYE